LNKIEQLESGQDSSLWVTKTIGSSDIYKEFKIYIEEANRIFSTEQKKASRDRQVKEAKALPEAEMEKVEIINLLQRILKTINMLEGSRTQSLLRKILRLEVYEKFKIYLREASRISSTVQKKASRDRHLKEAKALLEAEMEKVENINLLQGILKTSIVQRVQEPEIY
jgi:FAD synthase